MNTKTLLDNMTQNLFSSPYKEMLQNLYDEQVACGLIDIEEREMSEGFEYLNPILTPHQKDLLAHIGTCYQVMWNYAGEYGLFCGIVNAFEKLFLSNRSNQRYHFTSTLWDGLQNVAEANRHQAYHDAASRSYNAFSALEGSLDEQGQDHLVSIELGYDQRVYSASINAYYIGHIAVASIVKRVAPKFHAKAVANVLLLELELGYRGKGINFLDKLEEGEVQDHEQSEAAGY